MACIIWDHTEKRFVPQEEHESYGYNETVYLLRDLSSDTPVKATICPRCDQIYIKPGDRP